MPVFGEGGGVVSEVGKGRGGEEGGEEVRTNVSSDAGQDNLALARRLDGSAEVGVVPGVDLAVAADQRRVGIHAGDFLGEQAVGAGLRARGQDDGDVKGFSDGGVRDHVVAEDCGVVVSYLDESQG